MSRFKLPEGVPPDNQTGAAFSESGKENQAPDYKAPNMATPQFSNHGNNAHAHDGQARRALHAGVKRVDDDDDDDDVKLLPSSANSVILIAVIAVLLAALGAIVVMNSRQEIPLCSSQPEWNQYNCRPE